MRLPSWFVSEIQDEANMHTTIHVVTEGSVTLYLNDLNWSAKGIWSGIKRLMLIRNVVMMVEFHLTKTESSYHCKWLTLPS